MSRKHALTIAFTGVDGSGKSTLAARVADWLAADGRIVHSVKIRSGRSGLERLARDLNHADPGALFGWDTALMMMGAICWQSMRDIKPLRRETGAILLLDRCPACVLALARMHAPRALPKLEALFSSVPAPDAVIHVSVRPETAAARLGVRGGTPKTPEFLNAFEAGYRSLPEFKTFQIIDGNASPDAMFEAARRAVVPLLAAI